MQQTFVEGYTASLPARSIINKKRLWVMVTKPVSVLGIGLRFLRTTFLTLGRNRLPNRDRSLFLLNELPNRKTNDKHLRTTFLRTIAFPILLLATGISCTNIPATVGRSRDVVVVSSRIDTNLITENIQVYNYVPQKEELFKFFFASDTAVEKFNRFHAIFLYGSLQDECISTLLSPDAEQATKTDTFTLFKLNDLWCKDQLVVVLAISDPVYTQRGIVKYRNMIAKVLEQNYYLRIKKNYYNRVATGNVKETLKKFGVTFDLGRTWLIDSTHKTTNFIFSHAHFPDRSIFFYKEKNAKKLTSSYAICKRDSLTKEYYNGDYVQRDLTNGESIEFKGLKGIKLKGVWQNDSFVAGGPFISYFLTRNDTMYVIDGILFSPGERKSDYLTTLEVIMNSFQIGNFGAEKQKL